MREKPRLWTDLEKIDRNGQAHLVPNAMHLFFGVYGGKMRPADKEASGVLYYSFEHLLEEMKLRPDLFNPNPTYHPHKPKK